LKEMKIPAINQRDFSLRPLQLLSGHQSAEATAKNRNPVFLRHPPPRNLVQMNIIPSTVIFSRLRRSGLAPHSFFHVSPVLLSLFNSAVCAISLVPNRSDWPAVPPVSETPSHSPIIVVGILGGIVKHDATPTSAQVEAFIRQQIQSTTMK